MKLIWLLLLTAALLYLEADATECFERGAACHSTDYHSYVDCVRRRHKRSYDCDSSCQSGNCMNSCNTCNCDTCNYSNCDNTCNSCCNTCCSNYIPCRTNHCCHRTCQAQCDSSKCRSTCRRNCFETVRKNSEPVYFPQSVSTGESSQAVVQNSSIINNARHNVTTIIHLNNVINNTNIIDVPININNTNDQNITLYTAEGNTNTKVEQKEQCCTVIGPRQCVSYPTTKCFHYRSKQCGAYCTADIVHREEKQVCESYYPGAPVNCKQQVYYIPQPTPRCVYQSAWPYVSCSIQRQNVGCDGCYSHYVDQSSSNYIQCPSQCYDQGYQVGSMYRQGPVYRPMYYHAPQSYNVMNYGYPPYQQGYVAYQPAVGTYQAQPVQGAYQYYPQPGGVQQEFVIPGNATSDGWIPLNSTNMLPLSNELPVQIEMNVEPYSEPQAEVKIRSLEKYKREGNGTNAKQELPLMI